MPFEEIIAEHQGRRDKVLAMGGPEKLARRPAGCLSDRSDRLR